MRYEPAYSSVPVLLALPTDLRDAIGGGATWESVVLGESGTAIYRITAGDDAVMYLKIAEGDAAEVAAEAARLRWLAGRLPVPRVQYAAEESGSAYLLMSAIPGYVTCDPRVAGDAPRVVRLLADGLRMLHALDPSGCPFDMRLDARIAAAGERVARGAVDEDDFDDHRLGRSARDLYAELLTTRPTSEDLVFTHGDYCLPNVLIDAERSAIAGFIDLGRAGVADRYQDLALAARSIAHNFGEQWVPDLFMHYGLSTVDHAKVAYYQLLDEFF